MPEYLAPGVYVEETSFRAKSIEGVGTSTTAFVGPTRKGPFRADDDTPETPELLTSYGDFERIYGGFADLALGAGVPATNYLAHAVLAFFNEGGSRLYVSRVVGAGRRPRPAAPSAAARPTSRCAFVARFPGRLGNGRVIVREVVAPASATTMATAPAGTLLRTGAPAAPVHHVKVGNDWRPADNLGRAGRRSPPRWPPPRPRFSRSLTVATDGSRRSRQSRRTWASTAPTRAGSGTPCRSSRRAAAITSTTCSRFASARTSPPSSCATRCSPAARSTRQGEMERTWLLAGGADGGVPTDDNYRLALLRHREPRGRLDRRRARRGGLRRRSRRRCNARLIAHAEARRAYRIAVLDTPPRPDARPRRARCKSLIDSQVRGALLPVGDRAQPARPARPRGHPARALAAAVGLRLPASMRATTSSAACTRRRPTRSCASALRFEIDVNFGQQEMLNPLGVNCLRLLSGRGYRVWGARLASSDPEWKYVSDRRYFNYLEVLDRPRHAVGGVRAERRAAVGERAADDLGLPLQRVAQRRAARHHAPRRRTSCAATAAR